MRKSIFRSAISLMAVGLISACAYGPKAERKTPMSYLSGESYETGPSGATDQILIPVVKRKEKATLIEGHVLTGEGIESTYLKNVQVGLYALDGTRVHLSTTGEGGEFRIHTPIHNGKYILKLLSNRYGGETPIEVSSYSLANVTIQAKKALTPSP